MISQHPDVAEAVNFAMDDEAYGQDVDCAVKLADGKDSEERDLKSWISGKVLAFKVRKNVWWSCHEAVCMRKY